MSSYDYTDPAFDNIVEESSIGHFSLPASIKGKHGQHLVMQKSREYKSQVEETRKVELSSTAVIEHAFALFKFLRRPYSPERETEIFRTNWERAIIDNACTLEHKFDTCVFANVKIHYFPSEFQGQKIRNAINGDIMEGIVGTNDELQYFVVTNATSTQQKTVKLFYNSPEEYEMHTYSTLSDAVKRNWRERINRLQMLRERAVVETEHRGAVCVR